MYEFLIHAFLYPQASFNVQEFAGKVGSVRKGLKSRADFIFIDAPHHVDAQQSLAGNTIADPRAWWTWQVCFYPGHCLYAPNAKLQP